MDLETLKATPSWEWPEDAGEMLVKTLTDRSAGEAERLLAAELAGEFTVIDDELAGELLSIAANGDEPEELRGRAAISLGPALEYMDTEGFLGEEFEDDEDQVISELMFERIRESLRSVYADPSQPKSVRRCVLEAAVRAPQEWHGEAVRAAWAGDDPEWKLTAVFAMRWVSGFDAQILEAMGSDDPQVHYQAVCAAGNWGVEAAWPHVAGLLRSQDTGKSLLLAAIEAAAAIRPREATAILSDLCDSDDEDIASAADEALAMAEHLSDE